MQRYFTEERKEDVCFLSEEDSYHLQVVMRKKEEDLVEVVHKDKLYIGKIEKTGKKTKIKILEEKETEEDTYHVTIAQALIKDKKMDFVLQKATELGVEEIIPLKTIRSVVKIDQKAEKKIERYQKIVKEASSQSKRVKIPVVREIMSIEELAKLNYDVKIICSVNEMSTSIKKVLDNIKISDRILFVVGAEGGFEDKEESFLVENGFQRVTLGKNVLRTETAPLYILSVVSYNFMR